MNDWIDDDEDDFLSAGFGGKSDDQSNDESPTEPPADGGELAMDEEGWTPAAGFPDGTNAVRLWADEDGNLSKVRVSLAWKEKLRNSSLSTAFMIALTYLNGWYQFGSLDEGDVYDDVPDSTSKQLLSAEALAAHRRATTELHQRIMDTPGPNSIVKGSPASASDYDGAVTVTLDPSGRAYRVDFDEEWLENEANSAAIARSVMNCYRWAKAKWRPPTVELTERGELLREQRKLSKELDAMLANGVQISRG